MLDIPLESIFNLFYIHGYIGEVDLNILYNTYTYIMPYIIANYA